MQLFKELVIWESPKLEAGDHFSNCGGSHKNLRWASTARTGCSVLIYALMQPLIYIREGNNLSMCIHAALTTKHMCCARTAHHTRSHTVRMQSSIHARWQCLSLHVTGRRAQGLIWEAMGSQPLLFHQHLLTTLSKSHCMPGNFTAPRNKLCKAHCTSQ